MIGYYSKKFEDIQKECLKYGVCSHIIENTSRALLEVSIKNNEYLLIVIYSDDDSYLRDLSIIRRYTKIPILIIKTQYKGAEKIAVIKAGADEYIQQPETKRPTTADSSKATSIKMWWRTK